MTAYEQWKLQYPLHAAAQLGSIPSMEAIPDYKSLVNSKDSEQWTPLHYCCFEGFADAVNWLIQQGGDIRVGNHFGSTPLHIAIGAGHLKTVEVLLDVVDTIDVLQLKNEDRQTPRQMLLIADQNQKEIRLLLDAKESSLSTTANSNQ